MYYEKINASTEVWKKNGLSNLDFDKLDFKQYNNVFHYIVKINKCEFSEIKQNLNYKSIKNSVNEFRKNIKYNFI